jgi:Tfp pilus assembly protein PilN
VGVGVAVGAVLALLFFLFMLQVARLSDADQQLAAEEAVNNDLRQEISALQEFAVLKQQLAAREGLVDDATSGRVLWSGVLGDLSKIIPGQMWLTSFSGTVSPPPVSPAAQPGEPPTSISLPTSDLVGTVTFQGRALNTPTVAQWLSRLEQVTGWVNPWATNVAAAQDGTGEFDFSGSYDLTTEATEGGSVR